MLFTGSAENRQGSQQDNKTEIKMNIHNIFIFF
jgi:hypothetical protein